jgi:hypothetical protein
VKDVTEESLAVGYNARGDLVLVQLTGKRRISHYVTEVVNGLHGYEYENQILRMAGRHQ